MCRPDGRHVLNNQGTDDYVLTKDHIEEIQQSSGFLAIKVNDNQLKTIEKE